MFGLNQLFQKKESVSLSVLQSDMHAHTIPGIDDGAKSIDMSLEMIRQFAALGYKKLLATPHIMNDFYRNTPDIILRGAEMVQKRLQQEEISMQFDAAAEYYADEVFMQKIKTEKLLTFGKNYVLFELPMFAETPHLGQIIFDLQLAGYTPVLAHPERYTYWYNAIEKYDEIRSKGVLLQLNVLSLTNFYSPQVRKTAQKLIDKSWVDFCGTDAHNPMQLDLISQNLSLPYLKKLLALPLLNASL